ncbi:MAG: RsmB/NOP family class I SAM-dependent RNA methyltransferase [Clostridiales bacterium]|nr:RsmB/NOP family class I SAM-dependent RNA methyltransferase [Clostridiales bacterium]
MEIPESYRERMQALLGEEWEEYQASLEEDRAYSFRVNTAKWSREKAWDTLELPMSQVPWVEEGFYYPGTLRPAKTPAYYAGLIYIQEASAMSPGSVLPVSHGDKILDLCAAPGGKATQLAARLKGTGVLYANDISASRGQALLKNLEMAGAGNIFVTAETPEHLSEHFREYFDAILVDAPCSGEGMLRKDNNMFRDWLNRGPSYYQPIQAGILDTASAMVKPGGYLLYSTCTFSKEENEGNVESFLAGHDNFVLESIPLKKGFSQGFLPGTVRLWPHKVKGEGHFLALLRRTDGAFSRAADIAGSRQLSRPISGEISDLNESKKKQRGRKDNGAAKGNGRKKEERGGFPLAEYYQDLLADTTLEEVGEQLYALPAGEEIHSGIHYLRTGLHLGQWKKERFIPSQALAMVTPKDYPNRVSFCWEDERILRYLKGETLTLQEGEARGQEGWIVVFLDEFPLGWAVRKGTSLKNKYNSGWRWQ